MLDDGEDLDGDDGDDDDDEDEDEDEDSEVRPAVHRRLPES